MRPPPFDIDTHGTVQWFGPDWGAPVCHPATHVDTPTGETCEECRQPITADDCGLGIPYSDPVAMRAEWLPYHRLCFLRTVIPDSVVAHLPRMPGEPERTKAPAASPREGHDGR